MFFGSGQFTYVITRRATRRTDRGRTKTTDENDWTDGTDGTDGPRTDSVKVTLTTKLMDKSPGY